VIIDVVDWRLMRVDLLGNHRSTIPNQQRLKNKPIDNQSKMLYGATQLRGGR
jgi:hypothetical protein